MAKLQQPAPWDWDALRAMLKLHAQFLQFKLRHVQQRFDSSDLVQSALKKGWENREQFRGATIEEREAWFRAILGNVVNDLIRQAKADKRDVGREQSLCEAAASSAAELESRFEAEQASPSEGAAHRESLQRLAVALDQMPAELSEVVVRHFIGGMSVREIVKELNIPRSTVGDRIAKGMQVLRDLLGDEEGDNA